MIWILFSVNAFAWGSLLAWAAIKGDRWGSMGRLVPPSSKT